MLETIGDSFPQTTPQIINAIITIVTAILFALNKGKKSKKSK